MIFLDTNVISEAARPAPDANVVRWMNVHDTELALPSVALAELILGVERIREAERSKRLTKFLDEIMRRFAGHVHAFDENSALIYGKIMGEASRRGRPMAIPDGMIAATALRHAAPLATRNAKDFAGTGLKLIDPWA